MVKYFSILFIFLFASCKDDDDQIIYTVEEECYGYNMVDTWSVKDSIEDIFISLDSIETRAYTSEFIFYENGIGKTYNTFLNSDVFFSWNIQCHPDIFTMNYHFHYEDSIVSVFELHHTYAYDISINEIDYKRMKLEQTDSINQVERKRVRIRELTRE